MGYIDTKDYAAMTDLVVKYLAKPDDRRPTLDSTIADRFAGTIRFTHAE